MPCSESALSLPQWLSLLKKRCLNQKEFKVRSSLLLRVFSWCMRLPASGFTAQYSVSQWQLFFAYISSTPFILQDFFGVSQLTFSLNFALNAVGIAIGAMLALKVSTTQKGKFYRKPYRFFFVLPPASVSATSTKICTSMRLLSFNALFCGFIFTGATATAMNAGRKYAGAASAVIGAVGFIFGGLVSPIVSWGTILFTSFIICTIAFGIKYIASACRR